MREVAVAEIPTREVVVAETPTVEESEVTVRPIVPPDRWRRRHFRFPARDARCDTNPLVGQLLNLARTGLALEGNVPLQIGCDYRLRVHLDHVSFWATGKVRWCALRKTFKGDSGDVIPVYHAGLSLEEVDEENQERLLDLLRGQLLKPPPEETADQSVESG
jgi:hypothetical protein